MIVALVALLIASLSVAVVRARMPSRPLLVAVLLVSAIGAGSIQYLVSTGLKETERHSAKWLLNVTSGRLAEAGDFLTEQILPIAKTDADQPTVDWFATFQMKADDIEAMLMPLGKNEYLLANYAAFHAEIEFGRRQLASAAQRAAEAVGTRARVSFVEFYLSILGWIENQLDDWASELSLRPASEFYLTVD